MDLTNPWLIFSGLFIGVVGLVLFNHGRKNADFRTLGAGVALCVYPYFVGSLLLLWLLFAAIVGGLYALHKHA
jgi:uncharacterized membrane protein YecN with MAPEG domain